MYEPSKRHCYIVLQTEYVDDEGYRAAIVTEGENGYILTGTWPYSGASVETRPYFWGHDFQKATDVARRLNARMGLTDEDVLTIVGSSMRELV